MSISNTKVIVPCYNPTSILLIENYTFNKENLWKNDLHIIHCTG